MMSLSSWLEKAKLESFDKLKRKVNLEPFPIYALYNQENKKELPVPYIPHKKNFLPGFNFLSPKKEDLEYALDTACSALFFKDSKWNQKDIEFIDFSLVRSFFTSTSWNKDLLKNTESKDPCFFLPYELKLKDSRVSLGFSSEEVILKGANKTQELCSILYDFYKALKEDESLDLDRVHFQFFNDSDFFLDIAKIRAFRFLYQSLLEEMGRVVLPPYVHIEFHPRYYLANEEDTNIMRQTSSLFSAMLSNVQSYSAYDYLFRSDSTKYSKRLTITMQWLLEKESSLMEVYDPLKGSYLIESLTYELALAGWERFLKLKENEEFLEGEIKQTEIKRQEAIKKEEITLLHKKENSGKEKLGISFFDSEVRL